ncbi:MAG TPA: hypothetical protein VL332_05290 [Candidatus Saccharimonadaceae bacterium]|jgi:hypothetical protein|nr:hypothetical protein [Candidatus Saccharimonadaceae bacterium]
MSEDTRRVLDMLTQGKITADEADRLLAAIGSTSRSSTTTEATAADKGVATAEAPSPKFLRITITRTGTWPGDDGKQARRAWMWAGHTGGRGGEVSIRVPVTLVRNGIRLGAMIPGLSGAGVQTRLRERGVDLDLSKIDTETINQLLAEFGEINIDVDSERGGKAQIRITCE